MYLPLNTSITKIINAKVIEHPMYIPVVSKKPLYDLSNNVIFLLLLHPVRRPATLRALLESSKKKTKKQNDSKMLQLPERNM